MYRRIVSSKILHSTSEVDIPWSQKPRPNDRIQHMRNFKRLPRLNAIEPLLLTHLSETLHASAYVHMHAGDLSNRHLFWRIHERVVLKFGSVSRMSHRFGNDRHDSSRKDLLLNCFFWLSTTCVQQRYSRVKSSPFLRNAVHLYRYERDYGCFRSLSMLFLC